jgi:hypothetical protein
MSSAVGYPQVIPANQPVVSSEDAVRGSIWQILAGLSPSAHHPERRNEQRFPYPNLLYLTPVAEDGISPAGDSIVVVGKHLSERGLGFFYQKPLPDRRMIASLQLRDGGWIGFLINITWCRFTQQGWYDSGGRFLQVVPSPVAALPRARTG